MDNVKREEGKAMNNNKGTDPIAIVFYILGLIVGIMIVKVMGLY